MRHSLPTALLLLSLAAPVATQQPGPTRILPGDLAPVSAAGEQGAADVALGNGAYLVVWEDQRAALALTSDPGGRVDVTDIFAARVDLQGDLIDNSPIVVYSGPFSQTRPHVAWNGSTWLVVWESERLTTFWRTRNVVGARIAPDGTVLDPTPIVIDDDDDVDEQPWDVASDGNDFAVVWQDTTTGGWTLDGATVDASGTVSNKHVVYDPPTQFDAPWNTRLEWAGNRYLLAYDCTYGLFGLLADASLQAVGQPFQLGGGVKPQVASGNGGFYVTWREGGSWGEVRGTPVSAAGTVAVPSGTLLSASVYPGDPHPDVAWDGSGWQVQFESWLLSSGWSLYASRCAPGGTLLQGPTVVASGDYAVSPVSDNGSGRVFTAWTDGRLGVPGYGELDVFGTTVDTALVSGPQRAVAAGPPAQFALDIAGDAEQRLMVFVSAGDGLQRIVAQRVDAFGDALDAEPIELASGTRDLQDPAVSFDGDRYLVVWEDFRGSVYQSRIMGRRVARDGTLLDPAPVDLMPGNDPDVAALGGEHLVASTHEPTNHIRYPKSVRVDGASGLPVGNVETLGISYARSPSVAAFGDRWMVAWQRHGTHDSPYASVTVNSVPLGGGAGTSFQPVSTAPFEFEPDLAVDPAADVALLVWNDAADLRAVRIGASGTLLDPAAGFLVSGAPMGQVHPAVSWDGSDWTVAWTDYRGNAALEPGTGDTWFGRITPSGTRLDGDGLPLADGHLLAEGNAAVSGARGITAVAWTGHAAEAPYGTLRIHLAALAPLLEVSPAHRGQPVGLQVTAALPGDQVYFVLGTNGRGPGTCIGNAGDLCLDLAGPLQLLGTATAGAGGIATLQKSVPAAAPLVTVHVQALLRRGPSGADSSKTDVVPVPILP